VKPPPEYPPEEGHYLRGNDYSPQMADAIFNHLAPRGMRAISADSRPAKEVNPLGALWYRVLRGSLHV
jgi:hypothetical protein